jgi:hypothetical protein
VKPAGFIAEEEVAKRCHSKEFWWQVMFRLTSFPCVLFSRAPLGDFLNNTIFYFP